MPEYDVITLSMFCNTYDYLREKQACELTYGSVVPSNYLHLFYTSSAKISHTTLVGNTLYIPCEDSRLDTYAKTFGAIKFITENYKFKQVIKTNASTYLNWKVISGMIAQKDPNDIYCTASYIYPYGMSGRGDFNVFSLRHCLDLLETDKELKNRKNADDYLMFQLWNMKYGPTEFYRQVKTIPSADAISRYEYEKLKNVCAIRLKNKSDKKQTAVDIIRIMHSVHAEIMVEPRPFQFEPIFSKRLIRNHNEKLLKDTRTLICYADAVKYFQDPKRFGLKI